MHAIQTNNKKGATMKKVAIAIMVVAVAAVFAVRVNQLINPPAVSCVTDSVVAHSGDTYWTLVEEANCTGGYDKQDRVDAVIKLNGGSAMVQHGQMVYFPQGK
jgi:hypothetical protein